MTVLLKEIMAEWLKIGTCSRYPGRREPQRLQGTFGAVLIRFHTHTHRLPLQPKCPKVWNLRTEIKYE